LVTNTSYVAKDIAESHVPSGFAKIIGEGEPDDDVTGVEIDFPVLWNWLKASGKE
jgi:hypothetical protein